MRMSERVENLADPLQDIAEDIGFEELRERLTNPNRQRELNHVHDFSCPECNTGITESNKLGELGHLDDCSRRPKKYYGKRQGSAKTVEEYKTPDQAGQSLLTDFGKRVRADGGESA